MATKKITLNELRNLVKQIIKEETTAPADVKNYQSTQDKSNVLLSKSKNIDTLNEFSGAFEAWFKSLGFEPGKIQKHFIKTKVDEVLTKLGY
jgi:hypothetical protein